MTDASKPATSGVADARPLAAPEGFREYDVRWRYPEEIGTKGLRALGVAIGAWLEERNAPPRIVVGRDYRAYSPEVQASLIEGFLDAGLSVIDIGMVLSPILYYAQFDLDSIPGAMVTASHNPNGWTGVKFSARPPLSAGPDDIQRVHALMHDGRFARRPGGSVVRDESVSDRYLKELQQRGNIARPLRVLCATGNGTAGAFAPQMLESIGCDVIPHHTELDFSFPHYNPNPESEQMLADMGEATRQSGADIGIGFDGDGDRVGVVDEQGTPVYADKLGLLIARTLAARYPGAGFLIDVKSTSLFESDPVLGKHGCHVQYARTGHSHMKLALRETGALAGFERSGHFLLAPPVGRGYDDGLLAAAEVCHLLADADAPLSRLEARLPPRWTTPTLQPGCPDNDKYRVVEAATDRFRKMTSEGEPLAGHRIEQVMTVTGARVSLAGGAWALVRASSNAPNLVVIVESHRSQAECDEIRLALAEILDAFPEVDSRVLRLDDRT